MSRYKAYPEYKDSKSKWLGAIPKNWNLFDGKRLFSSRRESALESDEQLAASQKYGVIPQNLMMELNDSKVMLALKGTSSFRHVNKNDFVISLRSFEGGIEHSSYDGCVSPAYTVLCADKNTVPAYFKYLLKSAPYIAALQASTDSLRDGKSIAYEQFGAIPLPYPEPEEQGVIAAFLDQETAKIDALIEKQQRLIELLKEKRQAVISHAVTQGLNPTAPMKDSGVEWLGMVPAHWKICALKYPLKSLDNRRIPLSGEERSTRQGEYRYYGASGVIDYIDDYIFDEPTVLVGEDGANLVNRSTPLAFSACGRYWVNNHAHILKTEDGLVDFWAEAIEHIDINPLVSGSAQPKLTAENLNNLKISFPLSRSERKEISDFIKGRKIKFKGLIDKAGAQISLLQERRTALISAAVTGKIDVRDWQPAAA